MLTKGEQKLIAIARSDLFNFEFPINPKLNRAVKILTCLLRKAEHQERKAFQRPVQADCDHERTTFKGNPIPYICKKCKKLDVQW